MSEIINPVHSSGAASGGTPILDASGEMSERVRVCNWAATPLGSIDSWSTTLASYVNLILMSPQPAVLIWGQDLTLLYNDGAIPTLGEKHPDALGRSYRDVFADAWPLVGQDIEDCLKLGKTPIRKDICIPLMRDGRLQENFYTYFLVPVYEGDRIVGVYDPFLDVTQQRIDRLALEAAAEAQRFLLRLTDAQWSAANGREIMQISAEFLGRHLNVGRVGYSEASQDQTSMSFETGWAQGELKTLSGSVPMNHWSEDTSTDFSRGRTVVYPDVRTEPSLASEVENYMAIGAISVIAAPFLRSGVWRGSLYVNHFEPRQWTEQEVRLVKEVAQRTAGAVDRAQAEGEVRALAERLRIAQQAGRMASWQLDFSTETVTWDSGSEWTFGRPPAQIKTLDAIFSYIHEDDREKVRRNLHSAIEGKGDFRSEFRIFWPDGSLQWNLAFGKTMWTAAGVPDGVVGININVTEQKLAGTALLQNEKLAAVGRLATTIAHEINNPLESVTNLIFLAKSSPAAPADIREYMETADRELRRVAAIVGQTLRFHKEAKSPAVCSGRKLMHETISIYQGRTINSQIQVSERHRSDEGVACFEGEIRQVLSNLIANAIDAMPHGGNLLLRSRIATHPGTGRRGLTLTIADTGTGMSSAVRDRIFEAFYSTKGIGGTGLGLWISKDIVDRHHGMLAVRSSQKEGRSGTVFSLFLPADAEKR